MRITRLSPELANQIAAGEVIERPASVVKELLENALDAQATEVRIELHHGGLNQIKVSDNGQGIVAEDLILAVSAHATSKINCMEDLYSIQSLGFRGEALASIASVSRLSLHSKPELQALGMQLSYQEEGWKIQPKARSQGTSVCVQDLFYQTPVRRKFLKTELLEFQAIDRLARCFALSVFELGVSLWHNGDLQWEVPAVKNDSLASERVAKLLGKAFLTKAIYFETQHAGLSLWGWVSGPEYQRSQNDRIWVYLNGRMLKDKLIHHAIKTAYADRLYPGRYPACLLYLSMDPALVDVNVHPTKHEVRFQEPRLVHDFISTQLVEVLKSLGLKSSLGVASPREQEAENNAVSYSNALHLSESRMDFDYKALAEKNTALPMSGSSWVVLNPDFVLSFLQERAYLLKFKLLQEAYFFHLLQDTQLPLTTRPLLFPLRLGLSSQEREFLQEVNSLLLQLGLELEILESSVQLKTLPLLLPDLLLQEFMLSILREKPRSIFEFFRSLARHQPADLLYLREEQISEYQDFLRGRLGDLNKKSPCDSSEFGAAFFRPLSRELCQRLFDE